MKSIRPTCLDILLADDLLPQARLAWGGIHYHAPDTSIHHVKDGTEVIHFFEQANPADYPKLILLDLDMPRMCGVEVLIWLKEQYHLRHIPIVILSSSDSPEHIERCLTLGANEYMQKPFSLFEYRSAMKALLDRYILQPLTAVS